MRIPPETLRALRQLGQQGNATLFMVLMAAAQVFCARLSGQDDFGIGFPSMTRPVQDLEPVIGPFLNTLVLRASVREDPSFIELLDAVKRECLGAFANQDAPFEQILDVLDVARDTSRHPLFQAMLILEHATRQPGIGPLRIEPLTLSKPRAKFDISFLFTEDRAGLELVIEYSTALFDASTIDTFLTRWTQLLSAIAERPELPVRTRLPLEDEEQARATRRLDPTPLAASGQLDRRALPAPAADGLGRAEHRAPRDGVESRLIALWARLLGRTDLGIADDFFHVGGNSIQAAILLTRIEEAFGFRLPLTVLFRAPTVETLAQTIRSGAIQRADVLVDLAAAGDGPRLYCVHPAGGAVFCYASLARELGSAFRVHGLQAPGLYGERAPFEQVEALAAHYLDAIAHQHAGEPGVLGGWSFGGLVAFEMARQLELRGERPPLVVLFDARARVPESRAIDDGTLISEMFDYRLTIEPDRLRAMSLDEALRTAVDLAMASGLVPDGFGVEQARALLAVYRANTIAQRVYTPQAYGGDVLLFRARDESRREDVTLGWDAVVKGTLIIEEIAGTHQTILRSAGNVRVLAEHLRGPRIRSHA